MLTVLKNIQLRPADRPAAQRYKMDMVILLDLYLCEDCELRLSVMSNGTKAAATTSAVIVLCWNADRPPRQHRSAGPSPYADRFRLGSSNRAGGPLGIGPS